MTFLEAVEWVEQRISPLMVPTGDIERRIDLENKRICRELRVPRRLMQVVGTVTEFALPADISEVSDLRVYQDEPNRIIPVYTVSEANLKEPRWQEDTFMKRIVVYDPMNPSSNVMIRGGEEDITLYIEAVVVPANLVQETDTLMGGVLPEYHDLVVKSVAGELLLNSEREAAMTRGQILRLEFQADMRKAWARTYQLPGRPQMNMNREGGWYYS